MTSSSFTFEVRPQEATGTRLLIDAILRKKGGLAIISGQRLKVRDEPF